MSREAALFVDTQLAPFAHRTSVTSVDRLVDAAIARFEPARAQAERLRGADARHVTIEDQQVSFTGTMRVTAELDLADALDFGTAVTAGAEALKALGSEESLDARRASAVGEMARSQLALSLAAPLVEEGLQACLEPRRSRPPGRAPRPPHQATPSPRSSVAERWSRSTRSRTGASSPTPP